MLEEHVKWRTRKVTDLLWGNISGPLMQWEAVKYGERLTQSSLRTNLTGRGWVEM